MAVIQNSAIIQKLIDELELYPGLDKIPTELAEKILPVFQVNDQAVNFKEAGEKKALNLSDAENKYVVPAGKQWELYCGYATITASGTAKTRIPSCYVKDENGNYVYLGLGSLTMAASDVRDSNITNYTDLYNLSGYTINIPLPQKIILTEGMTLGICQVDSNTGSLWAACNDVIASRIWLREFDI